MFDFVVGLGQGGGRLAAEFQKGFKVPTVYMNLAGVDFMHMRLPKDDLLIVETGGTGRNPEFGESIVTDHAEQVERFLLNRKIVEAEHVLVTVGGGGGAGTGFLFAVLEMLVNMEKEVFLVYTLPEKREGIPTKPNALKTLNRVIVEYLQKDLISILLIDNDYCVERYGNGKDFDYWGAVNTGIVASLKRFWMLTQLDRFSAFIDMAGGYKALDQNDVRRILFAKSGYTDLRFMQFEKPEHDALSRYIKTSSLVFGSLDVRTAKRYVISIGIPASWKRLKKTGAFVEEIFQAVSKATRHTPDVIRTSYFNEKLATLQVSIMLTGMARSGGIDKMIRGAEKDRERLEARGKVEKLILKKVITES